MAEKDESILDLLAICPWWVSVLVSGIVYVVLKIILPSIDFQSMPVNAFIKGISKVAPIIALVLLLPAPISALNSWRKGRRLDYQKDLDSIRALNWREFEELVGEAYRRQGYKVIENTGPGSDEGIDLVLKRNSDLVLVQCKHWRSTKVGANIVREVYGVMMAKKADHAILITSGFFT